MLYRIKDQKILLAAKTKKVLYTAFIAALTMTSTSDGFKIF